MKLLLSLFLIIFFGSPEFELAQENKAFNDNIVYTVLYDNTSINDSIFADNGFSCLIESEDRSCLFDAGKNSGKFIANVDELGVDCTKITQIVVSHFHGDHMGGLFDILPKCSKPVLYLPYLYPVTPDAPRSEKSDNDFMELLNQMRPYASDIIRESDPVKVCNNYSTTGTIEEQTFEQALIIPTSKGLVILTGCAHPGILNIVKRAKEIMSDDVFFVFGGFHLVSTDQDEIKNIASELKKLTKYIGPCHCTGEKAQDIFRSTFKEDYIEVKAGMKLKIGEGVLQ